MNGNTIVIASISLLLLQHSASFSKLSWSDLSLVKWQLSALKDFLKRELRVIQGESVQFSFTPTHSLFLYFLLRFPGTDILYKYKPQLYSHASLTQVSRSLPLHDSLELYSAHNLLGAKTHSQNAFALKTDCTQYVCHPGFCGLQQMMDSRFRSGRSDTHADLGFVVSVKRAWVWLAAFGRELNVRVCKAQGQKQEKTAVSNSIVGHICHMSTGLQWVCMCVCESIGQTAAENDLLIDSAESV